MSKRFSQYSQFKEDEITEHILPLEVLANTLETSINITQPELSLGLNDEEYKRKLNLYGPNTFTQIIKVKPIIKFLKLLFGCFNLPLLLLGILCFILIIAEPTLLIQNCYVGTLLVSLAVFNAILDYIQIQKSDDTLEDCTKLLPQVCYVIRNKNMSKIPISELVPGDVILLKEGEKIPADIIIFHSTHLVVNNSSLTGETQFLEKSQYNDNDKVFEAKNLVFKGTTIVCGNAYGIVIRTGNKTILGKMMQLSLQDKQNDSKLTRELQTFVFSLYAIDILTVIIVFILVYNNTKSINKTFLFSASLLLTWVPEGLPASIRIILAIAIKTLAQKDILVKDFKGIETLGSITMLITDKVGILTRNQMSVSDMYCNMQLLSLPNNLNKPIIPFRSNVPGVEELFINVSFSIFASFDRYDITFRKRRILGTSVESGLLKFVHKYACKCDTLKYPKVYEYHYTMKQKFDLIIYKLTHANGYFTLFVKGDLNAILNLCSQINIKGDILNMTDEHLSQINEIESKLSSQGKKVIAFAQLDLVGNDFPVDYNFNQQINNLPKSGYKFNGLLALEDPPKHGIREAIGKCRSAGIKVIMVSDDNALCAEAIANKTNLMVNETKHKIALRTSRPLNTIKDHESSSIIINGENMNLLTDEEWDNIFINNEEIIFTSAEPCHKLEIIKRAQSIGHIVGMIGDGVKDAPALKQADLSIAMADSSSEAVKEIASIILMDNNFTSIVKGIEEGRRTFINLKKCIKFTCTHTFPEVIPQILPAIFPIPAAMSTILTVIIDLGFDLCTSLSFAWDEADSPSDLMRLQPRIPVTLDNIDKYRRFQNHRIKSEYDAETNKTIKMSLLNKIKYWFTTKGKLKYIFERRQGEYLVDLELISWSWFEAGILETIVSFLSFFWVFHEQNLYLNDIINAFKNGNFDSNKEPFTSSLGVKYTTEQLLDINAQGQSAFVLSIMVMQAFNLFAVKAHLKYPFGKHMFNNWKNFISVLLGFIIGAIIIYIPFLNIVFGSSYHLKLSFLWIPIVGGLLLLIYTTLRVYISIQKNTFKYTKTIKGLFMDPTTRTRFKLSL